MWQRVQTIFLVLIAICMFLMLFFPMWIGGEGDNLMILYPFYLKSSGPDVYFPYTLTAVLAISAMTIALIEITRYNNRITQIKLGALNSLLMAGAMILPIYLASDFEGAQAGSFGIGVFLPAIGLVFNMIANRFIRKDEKLVRESDRLR